MTISTILAIILSVGAIALCIWTDFQRDKEGKILLKLFGEHSEIMRHMTNCMGMLE